MKPFADAELEALLAELESDRVERKQSLRGDATTTVREAVCAFANDMPGHGAPGVVFIGARDDGSPLAGFEVTDQLLRQLADIKTDGNIAPPPTLLVEKRHLAGADFAVVTVWPCDTPPARYKGRIHVRWGPRRGLASAQDERILNERRRHRDRPYDIQPLGDATLDEMDRLRFEQEYLPSLVARDVLAANDRSIEQKLAVTKMVVSDAEPVTFAACDSVTCVAESTVRMYVSWLMPVPVTMYVVSSDDVSDRPVTTALPSVVAPVCVLYCVVKRYSVFNACHGYCRANS